MRTTLSIDEDILAAARSIAAADARSLGQVISDLARKGLHPSSKLARSRGIPVFDVSDDVAPLTAEMVRRALDEP